MSALDLPRHRQPGVQQVRAWSPAGTGKESSRYRDGVQQVLAQALVRQGIVKSHVQWIQSQVQQEQTSRYSPDYSRYRPESNKNSQESKQVQPGLQQVQPSVKQIQPRIKQIRSGVR